MRRNSVLALLMAGLCGGTPSAAPARTGGLNAVAVSPDGKFVAAGGESRVLYILAGDSLQVQQRLWLGAQIKRLAFNKDGSRLLVEGDDRVLRFLEAGSWKSALEVKSAESMSTAVAADLVAVAGRDEIRFHSMLDGTEKGKVALKDRLSAFALDREGKKLAVLTASKDGGEKKVAYGDIPKDLNGLKRKEFEKQNDGNTASLLTFECPSGKPIGQAALWYSASNAGLFVAGETTYVLTYDNTLAKIEADGKTELFEGQSSYNYGHGVSEDRTSFLLGGLRSGTRVTVDGMKMATFQVDQLPGWPEYYSGFGFALDGTGYGVTTAYRIVKIGADGKVVQTVPVY